MQQYRHNLTDVKRFSLCLPLVRDTRLYLTRTISCKWITYKEQTTHKLKELLSPPSWTPALPMFYWSSRLHISGEHIIIFYLHEWEQQLWLRSFLKVLTKFGLKTNQKEDLRRKY